MKLLKILFVLLLPYFSNAQDAAVTVSPSMFNPINEILIATMDGWQFKAGDDKAWMRKNIDTEGWQKLKPTELSAEQADKSGKLEGWLRFTFKLNKAFSNIPLAVRYSGWAAAELYIDGKLIESFGNTGTGNNPFQEYNPSNKLPVILHLEADSVHIMALHFVDYVSPFSKNKLKSETNGLHRFIRFTGPVYYSRFSKHIREWPVYSTTWLVVFIVLMLFFWLLAFLNHREKNLRLFSLCATLFMLQTWIKILSESNTISFSAYEIYYAGFSLFASLGNCVMIIIISLIFKNKIAPALKIFLVLYLAAGLLNLYFKNPNLAVVLTLIPFILYIGYIYSSWKTLNGAQWSIVIGLLLSVIMICTYAGMMAAYKTEFFPGSLIYASVLAFSFPLSLLAYVAIRFKEIIGEVQQKAKQVVQLSEEKREQVIRQKVTLEEEVKKQTVELRTSLENLKATQSQLIQSEKMASLGELTAGIAHEIQNPLNFVNNFSEVNNELIEELKSQKSTLKSEERDELLNDIYQNNEKINHHGKRADAIVKGMLQHSQSGKGRKEPTDINALCDEYLRLSYHGLRAKDKSFNASLKTDFDLSIEKINIFPQDIGKVIMNLLTNAFYAVNVKAKHATYEPTVSISTKKLEGEIEINVSDNGNGIPKHIIDKIFQPFFTTKPTGQGTGLGLSLAYDIVKAHGGELKVESSSEQGTIFIIQLKQNS